MVSKIVNLWKHVRRRKALVTTTKVNKGDYYFLFTNNDVKNEKIYYSRYQSMETVLIKIAQGATLEHHKKLVQFCLIFYILSKGHPMSDYMNARGLFKLLKVRVSPLSIEIPSLDGKWQMPWLLC